MKALREWFTSLLSEDRRMAEREKEHGLHAHYWDGGPPRAREIRDISLTGLYLQTEEHWHPGTLVTLTLQRTDSKDGDPERTITVQGQVVRSYEDGVGVRFILPQSKPDSLGQCSFTPTLDRQTFHQFLRRFGIIKN